MSMFQRLDQKSEIDVIQERLVEHDFRLKLEDSEQRREDAGKEGGRNIWPKLRCRG